ncbi:hypothetical protein ABNP39_19685 (plasmid) [Pantoea dispersa]|uniref:hypothetical protein n=1 Tax=Pantoea TaxID=53335 RepID=UPI0012D761A9|nr:MULTISPECIES: hypothetical protein [Pantoea]
MMFSPAVHAALGFSVAINGDRAVHGAVTVGAIFCPIAQQVAIKVPHNLFAR